PRVPGVVVAAKREGVPRVEPAVIEMPTLVTRSFRDHQASSWRLRPSVLGLEVRLDLPEELVDTARDLGEQVGGVSVAERGRRLDGPAGLGPELRARGRRARPV